MRARDNPFRVELLHQLKFRFETGTIQSLISRLASMNWRGAIVGPHGTGKTTLIEELRQEFGSQGLSTHLLRLTDEAAKDQYHLVQNWLASGHGNQLLILDGAEQLDRRNWRIVKQVSEQFRGLLITSHRSGMLSTLQINSTDEALFQNLVLTLLEDQPELQPSAENLRNIWLRHRGNIRNCLRDLYDEMAQR